MDRKYKSEMQINSRLGLRQAFEKIYYNHFSGANRAQCSGEIIESGLHGTAL